MKLRERPEPITRQENWDDYNCFLLERILDELIKLNKSSSKPEVVIETKPEKKSTRKSTRGGSK